MDAKVGAKEYVTQRRLIQLFDTDAVFTSSSSITPHEGITSTSLRTKGQLPYIYLGNWEDRKNNSGIEPYYLKEYLERKSYADSEINSAIHKLKLAADNMGVGLYKANKAVYNLLRYGVNVNAEDADTKKYVKLIDWNNPHNNDFYIAEEVTVFGQSERRPDLVIYVNGIALAVIELKRSKVSVHEGIRQNIRNQQEGYIPKFFTTVQLLFAGNDTEGLHYGVIGTPEKFWLRWKEPCGDPCTPSIYTPEKFPNELDRSIMQFFTPERFLEYIHDYLIYDGGVKKVARPNQYFGIKAAQPRLQTKDSGIIWHSQGSGKSLTMVWLAKWIRENQHDARVVIITDRDELDKQIETGFKDAEEKIQRAKSGSKLLEMLNNANPWLICTLIHKFGNKKDSNKIQVGGKKASKSLEFYLQDLMKKLPTGFKAKGNVFVFVDECHRTQGGMLHQAMKAIMGNDVMLIGFTGTPLLKETKKTSMETFGPFIHTYKFNEAVEDGVILDLRYEARNVEQYLGKKEKIDEWFATKTAGLSNVAKMILKQRWANLEKLFSSKDRMSRIVTDICTDMGTKRALEAGYGNAMLVADSIYQACRYWELFQGTELKGHCAIVTSYDATTASVKDEYTGGDGETEDLMKYDIYRKMLGDKTPEQFEAWAKQEFTEHPATMKLLIVVEKLLTGFDAPSATYLYIDKKMHDHNLFQAVCRVNRVDSEEKDYGYIIDYQDLFGAIQNVVEDYTKGAFDVYEKEDVEGLMTSRLEEGKKGLESALQAVVSLCEVVVPQTQEGFFAYFVYGETAPVDEQQCEIESNAPKRETFYKLVNTLVRRYIDLANEMEAAGYTREEAANIKKQVDFYNDLKDEIKLRSGDALDLKYYDPAMRQLIDNYVRAEDSEKLVELADISFLDLIEQKGMDAINDFPSNIKKNERSVAELLAANMRKMIISERTSNPKYFDNMSALLNQLLEEQRSGKLSYKEMIEELINRIRDLRRNKKPAYPQYIDTEGKQALYDNLDKNVELALKVHEAVKNSAKHGFRDMASGSGMKMKAVRKAVKKVLSESFPAEEFQKIMDIIIAQKEY